MDYLVLFVVFFSSHIMSIAVLYPRCLLFMGTIHVLFL